MDLIEKNGIIYALIAHSHDHASKSQFFSPPSSSLQLGSFARPAGFHEEAHSHATTSRIITNIEQALFITKGKICLYFHDSDGTVFRKEELCSGDIAVLMDGIHSLKVIEAAQGWSIKQGPFKGEENDKVLIKTRAIHDSSPHS